MREATLHPGEQAGGFAGETGAMRDRDGAQATHEIGGRVAGEELAEGLADRQAARDREVAHALGLGERQREEGVAHERAVGDDAPATGAPGEPRREFGRGDAVGPDVRREVALEPGRDERLELGGGRTVGEHERLAAALAAAGGVEEADDVDLGLEGRGGLGGGPGGEHDEPAGITLREADRLVEPRLGVSGRHADAEHQDEVHLRGARSVLAFLGPGLVERRQDGGDLHWEARERVDQRVGHDQRPALRQAWPCAARRASPPAGPQEPAA